MTLRQIASLGKELTKFLALFAGCFRSQPGLALGLVYVQGLLSNLGRKNVEAIAMAFGKSARTLQRLLESVKWAEGRVRDQCQQLIAGEHAHAEAIGCIDESGTPKSGKHTVGVSNRVPGEQGMSVRRLLRIAFGRWSVENCFRQAKEELGLDHYEVRGWQCVHRHFYLTQLSHLFCARIRQKFDAAIVHDDPLEHLTTEQVRRAINTWMQATAPRLTQTERLQKELAQQEYYQKRNAQAQRSHTKTRKARLKALGIDVDRIKSCLPPLAA